MARRRRRFNSTPIEILAELKQKVETPFPAELVYERDHFFSWTHVATEQELGGERWLLRSNGGGLAWLHVDRHGNAFDASIVGNDDARSLWPRLILQFTDEEQKALKAALQPASKLSEALEEGLGAKASSGVWLAERSSEDGTTIKTFLAHNRGIIRAWVHGDDNIVKAELVTGDDAWALARPLIDPQS